MLASANFSNPLLWAVLIGWIMSVVLHEFAHGLIGFWGGDYTVRDRGGLTLNPLQYIDPLMSIALPALFLMMGGIPLPGGATYIRRDLLRGRRWDCAVSAAGPAMNLLIFLGLCAALHPMTGWINYGLPVEHWTMTQIFAAGMAWLQLLALILNLVPIPPLDGFGIIAPFLPKRARQAVSAPQLRLGLFVGYYLLLTLPQAQRILILIIAKTITLLGIDFWPIAQAFNLCLFGTT